MASTSCLAPPTPLGVSLGRWRSGLVGPGGAELLSSAWPPRGRREREAIASRVGLGAPLPFSCPKPGPLAVWPRASCWGEPPSPASMNDHPPHIHTPSNPCNLKASCPGVWLQFARSTSGHVSFGVCRGCERLGALGHPDCVKVLEPVCLRESTGRQGVSVSWNLKAAKPLCCSGARRRRPEPQPDGQGD